MSGLKRRTLLQASVAAAGTLAAPQIKAQSKPEKLVYVGDNGPWHYAMVEEVAPAFEKATGIKIDFTLLPTDPWRTRLRTELGAGSSRYRRRAVGRRHGRLDRTAHGGPRAAAGADQVASHADFDWNDYLTGTKKAGTYDGKLCGIPYRITTGIFHYQRALLEQAGFSTPPGTWDELLKVAIAVNKPPDRYGFGTMGLQGAGLYSGFAPWLYSNGGRLLDFKTGEIYINEPKAVEALQFYGDLNTKHKVVPPEAMTWAFDDIVAGGQNDRYAMTQMFAPYGTLINDPKISKTGGKWAWTTVQGPHSKEEGRTWIDGHILGVPKYTKNKEWALEFIAMCCSREWQKRAMIRGNAPPLRSVLEDPEMVETIGWPPVAAQAIETGDSRHRAIRCGIRGGPDALGHLADAAWPEDREAGARRNWPPIGSAACAARGSAR